MTGTGAILAASQSLLECPMCISRSRLAAALVLGALAIVPRPAAAAADRDYPTAALADYVYGCLKANGETREMLDRCSCSIDVIASLVPYDRYVTASTFASMGQVSGEKGVLFRASAQAKASTGELRRAQAEAEIRCF